MNHSFQKFDYISLTTLNIIELYNLPYYFDGLTSNYVIVKTGNIKDSSRISIFKLNSPIYILNKNFDIRLPQHLYKNNFNEM